MNSQQNPSNRSQSTPSPSSSSSPSSISKSISNQRPRMERNNNNTRRTLVACLFLSAAVLHCESFAFAFSFTTTSTTTSRRTHTNRRPSTPYGVSSSRPRPTETLASTQTQTQTQLHAARRPTSSNENGAPAAAPSKSGASASTNTSNKGSSAYSTTPNRTRRSSSDNNNNNTSDREAVNGSSQGATRKRKTSNASKNKSNHVVGGYMKYSVLMDHDILTKPQEYELGTAVQLAQTTQAALDVLLEMKREAKHVTTFNEEDTEDEDDDEQDEEEDYLCYVYSDQKDDDEDTAEALSRISSGVARMEDQERQSLLPAPWRDDHDNGDHDKFDNGSSSSSNILQEELHMLLTDQDVAAFLNIPGGRTELHSILVDGALARETLIRSNVKLVVSIAKRWALQAARGSGETARAVYAGGRDRPSLDEAIQEGILGLTTAADRFDPDRGLRFSTYATHWVTNSVRQCFQTSSVGMRVPMGYHDARSKFRTLVKNYYDVHGETPDFETLAEEMNIKVQRLHLILKMTKPTLSIDGPLTTGTFTRAGQAGGSEYGDAPHIKDMLEDRDCRPEDRVELSFLRQSLENAMAQELAPHERDIVRLRLGLDDGVSMTTKQVAVACGGGLSISDVRMAEKRAFQKLRSPHALATYKFLAYLDFAGVDAATMKLR